MMSDRSQLLSPSNKELWRTSVDTWGEKYSDPSLSTGSKIKDMRQQLSLLKLYAESFPLAPESFIAIPYSLTKLRE